MASWAALNVAGGDARANLAEQRATEEAQDADNAAVYERALRCQQQRQTTEAKSLYLQLLSGHVHVSARLEYLCNKNVATMEQEAQSFDHALKYFAAALALDATDVVVWYQMATTALETGELWLARWTLEEGLKVDATYWPLVESLAQVLSQIGDEQEYQRVAQYLRQNDPHCATLKALDGQKKRARPPSARDLKLLKRTKKKLQHLREIADDGVKKRKLLQQEMNDELKTRMQPRSYELQQPSWTALGKLLLEAFEENNRSEHADVVQTAVEIKVTFDEQEVEKDVESEERDGILEEKDEKVDANKQQTQDNPPPAKRAKHKETAKVLDTSLLTGISDNDTQDSGIYLSEVLELQPRRRKSRRHEERLREEHAAAVRKARELDLAYRLGAFLPDYIDKEDRESTPEVVSIEWLPLLNVELVGAEFIIADASKKTLSKTASFILSSTEGSANNTDLKSSQTSSRELTVPTATPHVECVSGRQISSFIHENDAGKGSPRGVMGWIRHFLNHCGKWSNLKLGSEDEGIHQVCTWLEKALNGELDVARATTPTQSSVIIVADHSLTQSSRFKGNGFTLGAQLFLLELHFDTILQQPVRGKRRRTVRKLVETQLAQAQKLLFEFGWLEDSEETSSCPTGGEFLRLLWLIARMYERCGNPQMAQHYFIKCREKLLELNEGDVDNDAAFRVDLPNQKAENEITLAILDEKISGLRYSDVCSEARRLFEAGDHNRVVSILLGHFFPSNQSPRMTDFLNEFETEGDDLSRGDHSKKLFEMLLESIGQSSNFTEEGTVLFLLTTLFYVIEFLDGLDVKKEPSTTDDSIDEACVNALAAMDFLLKQLTQNNCERIVNRDHRLLLRGLCMRCLKPSILLRFDSPNDILPMIRVALEVENTSEESYEDDRRVGVDAMARLLYVIRSLSGDEFRNLLTLVPHPVKRKQPRRDRIRVVLVELLRFLNRAFRDDNELALSFPLPKRSALMTLCCTLMKEEEVTMARSDAKTPKQLFGNGAILFVLLFESFCRPDQTTWTLPSQLVELIHLLHGRLGRHGICSLTYFSETSGDSGKSSCFLETCTVLLNKFVQQKAIARDTAKSPSKSDEDSAEEDEEEAEDRFQNEVCQCYRCLYDVQILPGCEDHKTGTTFTSLQSAEQSVKHEDALRLARFAVPILLATKPKNNGQKKERLKLLYAVRDALSDSSFAALSVHPATVSPLLEAYLTPRGLPQGDSSPPFPPDTSSITATSADETCLGHLWYLMGANFILGRVKRRGNLGELTEMEQHVRERVEFLMKDVLYYHPDRIDSWVRLGKTMKELYHAATDAFAAVLGRKLRIQAFQWYTTNFLATESAQMSGENTQGQNDPDIFSFQNVVLGWDLFKRIKEWQGKDTDGHKTGGKAKDSKEEPKEDTVQDQIPHSKIPIEEFATTYITQVIEFARRCFEMAARLAEEAVKKHKTKLQDKRDRTDEDNDFDEELEDLQNKIIECNEECGLLLYNVLQEFSLMKELNLALFPRDVYSRLVTKTLAYFRRGLEICEANEEAHEDHFRLLYMIGKTLKKRRWCELRLQDLVDPEALATATEMADYFSKAEAARGEGDKEHALVHAFYSLQALRIDLTISESPSTSALRLVCSHFYEEEEEKVEEEDDESADSAGGDEKNSQETTASATSDTMKATSSKTKEPSDPHTSCSTRKDEVLALLSDAEWDDSVRELNVTLARGWLALNIIEALESIPDEDRYFHPSRYVLARIVYWLSTFYSALEQSGYKSDNINALLDALQARRSENNVVGPSDAAARALKEMTSIFDKRRPQIVAIWFSEYIPTAKKFEELNQRQMKYDYYRLKYWRFYIALLRENAAYGRLKEVGSWVLACKEEHDVIDIMLGSVLEARGKVLRSRLQEFLDTAERAASERPMNMMTQTQLPGESRPVDALLKQLAKTYTYYLEVLNAQQRLAHVVDNCGLLLENAELPMVAVFFMGATKYPSEMPLLEKDAMILDRDFNTNVTVIMNALRRDELPPRIYDAQNREAWKAFLDAARSFCEDKWSERSGKGKPSKKHARPKTANAAAPSNVAAVATSPAVPNSSQSTPIGPS
ncbi:hypothetical protein PC129_g12888 [Phytophthora cactorum]|uniref:Uncharacterized protein n=2 Tax=Phytophthora cactorum TaxID=29920 RepID=A0A329RUT9_9STRA|nr:hypothetical protein Pcac1_g22801 [Phytophthora cactorum]KAG2813880.1 hypothetical protein PC112_g14554 [Phytophthora cactorum]KAG2815582.1 hypothetical protein PC111_g13503 [Phytophthora cactorum]KAG2852809.1 hypothetical protein PC113_g14708 [Phytophthora cactorum]KAG2894513.1 hypothetical protein PC114_g15876 [Phytophthora cactorum]